MHTLLASVGRSGSSSADHGQPPKDQRVDHMPGRRDDLDRNLKEQQQSRAACAVSGQHALCAARTERHHEEPYVEARPLPLDRRILLPVMQLQLLLAISG
ncbi:hypothetical protein D3C75_1033980 [compost metagenome]